MLHIYFARENIDKDRFMYERIGESLARIQAAFNRVVDGGHPETGDADNRGGTGEPGGVDREPAPQRVLLVVPEQYTLQAEQDAMTAMGLPGFIDFDVLSMTSLGRRVYAGAGCRGLDFIDRYGKIMLVTKLLIDCATSLKAFGGISPSTGLASKISDMISELKNFNVSPQDLEGIAARLGDKDLLGLKLADVALIYAGFESELSGKLFDTADHLKDFARKIPQSPYIATSELWLSGYDYLSPAMKDAVIALSSKSIDTNILLTADPDDPTFSLTNGLMDDLMELARDAGIPVRHIRIDDRYAKPLPPALAFLEQNLFSGNATAPPADCGEICLTLAAGFYAEAETAASRICSLVRDEGLKYRDILVLCNDMRTRVPILKRVFAEYGLPVFVDQRRAVDHDPVIEFILALPEAAAGGRAYADVFRLLKTGLTGISRDEFETLENYVLEYRIRGGLWDRDFTYGGPDPENPGFNPAYTAGEMQSLNKARGKVSALLGAFEQSFKKSRSARDRTEALRDFLTEYIGLPERIQTMAQELENAGNLEYAAELTAIEGAAFGLLDQLGVALGDIPVSAREYADCLRAGFGSLRMGMLPTGRDQIVIGTMQRTRSAAAAAVFVIGANDGVLPAATEDDGILNGDEKQRLESSGNFLGRDDDAVYYEEQLAIYRNLIKASKKLYISCSASDMDGKDLKPSPIFRRIERLLPGVAVTKDIISAEDDLARIQYPEEALAHLADHAVNAAAGRAKITAPWSDVLRWIERSPEYRPRIDAVRAGLAFPSKLGREKISPEFIERLTDFAVSPSQIERYSRCRFSWLMGSALKLGERRIHELDPRSFGDIYHELLMGYGERVNKNSAWETVTREECADMIRELYDRIAPRYREGLLKSPGGLTEYKAERITNVAAGVAWAVTNQVRGSDIAEMFFEAAFGRNAPFAPIEIETGTAGENITIGGRIDRVDIRRGEDGENAVITDYKSGSDEFSPDDVRGGWQLQLLLYLLAVSGKYRPGGVHYFGISEPHIEDKGRGDEYLEKELARSFKPKGSDAETNLEELMDSVRVRLRDLAAALHTGSASARPMTAKKLKPGTNLPLRACTYCNFKGICGYDPTISR